MNRPEQKKKRRQRRLDKRNHMAKKAAPRKSPPAPAEPAPPPQNPNRMQRAPRQVTLTHTVVVEGEGKAANPYRLVEYFTDNQGNVVFTASGPPPANFKNPAPKAKNDG